MAPALKSVKNQEFMTLIQTQTNENTKIVVFIEPQLSIDNLSRCRTSDDVTCFKQLSTAPEKSYLPNVADPVDGLFDTYEAESKVVSEKDDIVGAVDSGNRVIFVNLDTAIDSNDFQAHGT